jgi:F-type H+-transporting ATPase subunit epsilon
MNPATTMQFSLRVPTGALFDERVSKVFAVAEDGAFGLLPKHADHIAPLVPSVLVVTDPDGHEHVFGIDHGLLVKHGQRVEVVVRRALRGTNLASLATEIESGFLAVDEQERSARTALSRLEAGITRQLGQLRKPKR